jgi:transposase
MKERLRAIFPGDLIRKAAGVLLERWCARTQRSRLAPFVKVARTMRQRRDLILNAIERRVANDCAEGLNTRAGPIVRRDYGIHSADTALALIMLGAGPIDLQLPHERPPAQAAA